MSGYLFTDPRFVNLIQRHDTGQFRGDDERFEEMHDALIKRLATEYLGLLEAGFSPQQAAEKIGAHCLKAETLLIDCCRAFYPKRFRVVASRMQVQGHAPAATEPGGDDPKKQGARPPSDGEIERLMKALRDVWPEWFSSISAWAEAAGMERTAAQALRRDKQKCRALGIQFKRGQRGAISVRLSQKTVKTAAKKARPVG